MSPDERIMNAGQSGYQLVELNQPGTPAFLDFLGILYPEEFGAAREQEIYEAVTTARNMLQKLGEKVADDGQEKEGAGSMAGDNRGAILPCPRCGRHL